MVGFISKLEFEEIVQEMCGSKVTTDRGTVVRDCLGQLGIKPKDNWV
jgi:hypothetical protein